MFGAAAKLFQKHCSYLLSASHKLRKPQLRIVLSENTFQPSASTEKSVTFANDLPMLHGLIEAVPTVATSVFCKNPIRNSCRTKGWRSHDKGRTVDSGQVKDVVPSVISIGLHLAIVAHLLGALPNTCHENLRFGVIKFPNGLATNQMEDMQILVASRFRS